MENVLKFLQKKVTRSIVTEPTFTKLPSYQITKLQSYQVTKLPSYLEVTKLPSYQITELPS